jgi:hypothetical protein
VEVSGQILADCFPWGESLWCPFDRRLGGPSTSLDNVERRKILALSGLELQPLSQPAHSLLLYQLSRPKCKSTLIGNKVYMNTEVVTLNMVNGNSVMRN